MARRVLRVVAADRPPLVSIRDTAGGGYAYSGMLIELLPRLLEAAEVDAAYQLYPLKSGGGGTQLSNGTWTGIMGELTSGRADLALFPLTLTSKRANYIDATAPYMDAGYALLTRVVHSDDVYSFLLPFSWRTWLLLLTALVAVVVALSLLDSATRRARYRALERCYGLERAKLTRRKDTTMQYALESMMMLLGQGSAPRGAHGWAVKFMFLCWAVFSVIMLCAYTANLTANLTVSQLSTTIKMLAELKHSGRMFGVPADSSVASYFKNSSDALAASMAPNMLEYRDADVAVRDVRAGKLAAYASDYLVLKGYASVPPCDLSVSGEEWFGPGQLTIGLPLHSNLTARLDVGLIKLAEAGVLSELRRETFVDNAYCLAAAQDARGGAAGGLTPHNMFAVFALLGVGMLVAAAWATCEVVYYNRLYPHVEQLRQSKSVGHALKAMRTMRSGNLQVTLPRPRSSDTAARLESGGMASGGGGGGSSSASGSGLNGASAPRRRRKNRPRARFAGSDSDFDAAHFEQRVRSEGSSVLAAPPPPAPAVDPFDPPRPSKGGGGDDDSSPVITAADERQRKQYSRPPDVLKN